MKVFLAGPTAGYPELNLPTFNAAAQHLNNQDHVVYSTATHNPDYAAVEHDDPYSAARLALAADLAWLTREADAIVVLPGWNQALDAVACVQVAQALGLPQWEFGQFLLSDATPCTCPPVDEAATA
jgi:Domain of unknown function (DUF4406)